MWSHQNALPPNSSGLARRAVTTWPPALTRGRQAESGAAREGREGVLGPTWRTPRDRSGSLGQRGYWLPRAVGRRPTSDGQTSSTSGGFAWTTPEGSSRDQKREASNRADTPSTLASRRGQISRSFAAPGDPMARVKPPQPLSDGRTSDAHDSAHLARPSRLCRGTRKGRP